MKRIFTSTCAVLIFIIGFSLDLSAQCVVREIATESISLLAAPGGTANRSAVAYNPNARLYYSVNAGTTNYPVDTYNELGDRIATIAQGFDYRGAWWNPANSQFEGNGFDVFGIFVNTLDAETSFPTGTGAVVLTANQPNIQSIGDLDVANNEIVYFHNKAIHRYSRVDNQFLGQIPIIDIPENSNLNSNTVAYTGCEGMEYALYDYTNKRVLFVDRATGKVSASSQLPETAAVRTSFGVSYANGRFWVFNGTAGGWFGFNILDGADAVAAENISKSELNTYPNPVNDFLRVTLARDSKPELIRILSINGQVVFEQSVENIFDITINMNGYDPGIYLLNIINRENTDTKRIIVSR